MRLQAEGKVEFDGQTFEELDAGMARMKGKEVADSSNACKSEVEVGWICACVRRRSCLCCYACSA